MESAQPPPALRRPRQPRNGGKLSYAGSVMFLVVVSIMFMEHRSFERIRKPSLGSATPSMIQLNVSESGKDSVPPSTIRMEGTLGGSSHGPPSVFASTVPMTEEAKSGRSPSIPQSRSGRSPSILMESGLQTDRESVQDLVEEEGRLQRRRRDSRGRRRNRRRDDSRRRSSQQHSGNQEEGGDEGGWSRPTGRVPGRSFRNLRNSFAPTLDTKAGYYLRASDQNGVTVTLDDGTTCERIGRGKFCYDENTGKHIPGSLHHECFPYCTDKKNLENFNSFRIGKLVNASMKVELENHIQSLRNATPNDPQTGQPYKDEDYFKMMLGKFRLNLTITPNPDSNSDSNPNPNHNPDPTLAQQNSAVYEDLDFGKTLIPDEPKRKPWTKVEMYRMIKKALPQQWALKYPNGHPDPRVEREESPTKQPETTPGISESYMQPESAVSSFKFKDVGESLRFKDADSVSMSIGSKTQSQYP